MDASEFWEEEEQVERFAAREPDRRLLSLIKDYEDPGRVRVLDIGCAGGRNTEPLAAHGFDVFAVDFSTAMVERTRERVAAIVGPEEATGRVQTGRMEDLSRFPSEYFDLVVALGVYHSAETNQQWDAALSETARVMKTGGQLLVAVFGPGTNPHGEGVVRVEGERHLYDGLHSGRHYLVEADELDAAMALHHLVPVEQTQTVVVPLENGRRVTVNGLYRKRP